MQTHSTLVQPTLDISESSLFSSRTQENPTDYSLEQWIGTQETPSGMQQALNKWIYLIFQPFM